MYVFITVLNIGQMGKTRWKIENKSSNDLKNHGHYLKHAFSYDENAVKGYPCDSPHITADYKVGGALSKKSRFETKRQHGEEIKKHIEMLLSGTDIKLVVPC